MTSIVTEVDKKKVRKRIFQTSPGTKFHDFSDLNKYKSIEITIHHYDHESGLKEIKKCIFYCEKTFLNSSSII